MSNNNQQLVDYLYNAIFVQKLRCDHFNSVGNYSNNSIWNKHSDEKQLLDKMVDQYKKYYKDTVEDLKTKLHDIKETNINSYLTYDNDYYVNKYIQRIEEIDKYLVELDAKTFDNIVKDNLSNVSVEIDSQFVGFMSVPTLLGKLL